MRQAVGRVGHHPDHLGHHEVGQGQAGVERLGLLCRTDRYVDTQSKGRHGGRDGEGHLTALQVERQVARQHVIGETRRGHGDAESSAFAGGSDLEALLGVLELCLALTGDIAHRSVHQIPCVQRRGQVGGIKPVRQHTAPGRGQAVNCAGRLEMSGLVRLRIGDVDGVDQLDQIKALLNRGRPGDRAQPAGSLGPFHRHRDGAWCGDRALLAGELIDRHPDPHGREAIADVLRRAGGNRGVAFGGQGGLDAKIILFGAFARQDYRHPRGHFYADAAIATVDEADLSHGQGDLSGGDVGLGGGGHRHRHAERRDAQISAFGHWRGGHLVTKAAHVGLPLVPDVLWGHLGHGHTGQDRGKRGGQCGR